MKKCDKCSSEQLHFVKYKIKNGVEVLRKQCLNCGRLLTRSYKRNIVNNFNSLPYYDASAKDKRGEISIIFANYKQNFFNKSRDYYRNVYLFSDEWKHKRDLIMELYNYKCQECGAEATDVHHLTYERIFQEDINDLIPLCRKCHENKHK